MNVLEQEKVTTAGSLALAHGIAECPGLWLKKAFAEHGHSVALFLMWLWSLLLYGSSFIYL